MKIFDSSILSKNAALEKWCETKVAHCTYLCNVML